MFDNNLVDIYTLKKMLMVFLVHYPFDFSKNKKKMCENNLSNSLFFLEKKSTYTTFYLRKAVYNLFSVNV